MRVTPNAGSDRIEGLETRSDGTEVIRVRVAAVADKGKANAAVLVLLAKALGVPKSALRVTTGETSRLKVIDVTGPGAILAGRIAELSF